MGKIAIATDSNSGITQSEATELGIHVIPMPFYSGNKTYYEEIDLSQDEFYDLLQQGVDISTSMPIVGEVVDFWEDLLAQNDEILYIPMSSGLSSSCEAALLMAKEYEDKVQVVDNQRISVTMRQSVLDAKKLADAGKQISASSRIIAGKERNICIASKYGLHYQPYGARRGANISFGIPRGLQYVDFATIIV